ncbi:hypothetical protein F2Q69_00021596 [Brassica cretica]|uniref:Uncharacterized protein n=1 Tax=Brassica cretica TaxID=69181 RepID=A0A8S9QC16_BRACR|nr:hypothetical protein F2Q69_00021596 [Brassica cretica]
MDEGLSPIAPPEPPDNVNILSPLRILNNSAKPSPRDFIQTLVLMLACPTMETKLRGLIVEAQTGLLSKLISTFLFGLLVLSSSSTLVPLSGIYVVPLEEKLARIFHLVNMVFTDIDFPVCLLFGTVCFLNISQSELEAQALLVINHGVSVNLLERMKDGVRRFNEQSPEVKKQFYSRMHLCVYK